MPLLGVRERFPSARTPRRTAGGTGHGRDTGSSTASAIGLAVMAVVSLGTRLVDRRPVPAAAAHHHRDRAGHLRQQPAPAPRPARPATSSPNSADTLDDLFARLEASFESQRHFVANASHELRTPLTAERALLQVALADPDATADTLRDHVPGRARPSASSRNV